MFNTRTTLVIGLVGVCTALSVYAKPRGDEVNFAAANPLLQAITDSLIQGDSQIDMAYPRFDTTVSSIQNERIRYTLQAKVKNVMWQAYSTRDATTSFDAAVDFKAIRNVGIPGIQVTSDVTTKTDVMAFLRYAAVVAKQRGHFYGSTEGRAHALLDRAAAATNLSEVAQVLREGVQVGIDEFRGQIKKSYDQIKCIDRMECGTPTVDQWGNRQPDYWARESQQNWIQSAMALISAFEGTVIDYNASTDTLTLSNLSSRGFIARGGIGNRQFDSPYEATEPGKASLVFTKDSIVSKLELFQQVTVADLDKTHQELSQRLNGVVAHNPVESDAVQNAYREALVKFKEVINNQWRW